MSDIEPPSEDDEDDMDEELVTHSPEPPEFVEPDDSMQDDENSQPGKLHPEQSLPHVFKVGASQLVFLFFTESVKTRFTGLQVSVAWK